MADECRKQEFRTACLGMMTMDHLLHEHRQNGAVANAKHLAGGLVESPGVLCEHGVIDDACKA